MRKKRVTTIFIILLSVFTIGCASRNNKIYGYKSTSYTYNGGKVKAKLVGTIVSGEKETTQGTPYDLIISFKSDLKCTGNVSITNMIMQSLDRKSVVFNADSMEKRFKVDSDGSCHARFFIEGLNMEYVDYKIILKFKIIDEKLCIEKDVDLVLKREYKEGRSSDFWDKFMSI